MVFASQNRERIMETLKVEQLGFSDCMKRISLEWQNLPETAKAKYSEVSASLKIDFEKALETYRKGDDFRNYKDAECKQEAKCDLKKVMRTHLGDAPKRPPSGFGLFKKEFTKQVVEENKGIKKSECGKKLADMWQKIDEEKKQTYNDTSDKAREEWKVANENFKCTQLYTDWFVKREKTKTRENRLLNLRETPKRGKTSFALYADRHKDEVEPGKGADKGRRALKVKFASVSQEERDELEQLEKENKEAYEKELAAFKESERFLQFNKTKAKIEEEFKREAINITTLRFLREAPIPPTKSAFVLYFQEKEALRAGEDGPPRKKTKVEKKEDMLKTKSEWLALPGKVRKEFDNKTKEKAKEFEGIVKEWMTTEKWQAYIAEAKKLRIPVRNLITNK
jgi:hypothetical protein